MAGTAEWKAPRPCQIGDPLSAIDTPALLVDLTILEYNMEAMSRLMSPYHGVQVRPHAKAHKSPHLANLQMARGAAGVCCQTLVEAEALVYGGQIVDVFLTNQVIGKRKLARLAALAHHATMSVCVDDADNLAQVSEAAVEAGVNIDCVVEVDVGQNRCGVEPGEPAAILAAQVIDLPGVTFKGVHCYQGSNQHIRSTADREKAVDDVVEKVKITLGALTARAIPCTYVTGGGTGSFSYEARSGVYTEVQPGSYVFMDADYARNLGDDGRPAGDFRHSLFVLSTVQSVCAGQRAVLDAGMKALSMDSGVPLVAARPDVTYHVGGDEHGVVTPPGDLAVGDLVHLVPGHCDPTVNLHDWLVGVRDGTVHALWPILGRGPGV